VKKFGIFCAEVDATKVLEDSDGFLVMPAILAREGIYQYPEGKAYKPADELRDAAWTADGARLVAYQHPKTLLVIDRDDIKGKVENPQFSQDINGIRAHLRFFKKLNSPQFLSDIRTGKRKDVSIGFVYDYDPTPGDFNGEKYDFVQRKFLIDHVAAGVPLGRCTSPFCGIAVDAVAENAQLDRACKIALDTLIRKVAGDPWEETEDYIRSGHREPSDTCRTDVLSEDEGIRAVICKYGDKWEYQSYLFEKAKGWSMEKAKEWFREHRQSTDQDEEGELEKRHEEAKSRCGKYPISFNEGKGNLAKPEEYENVDEDDFADPCNFKYPMVPVDRLRNAWQRLHQEENRTDGGYSEAEWNWMKNRVERRLEAKGVEVKADADRIDRLLEDYESWSRSNRVTE